MKIAMSVFTALYLVCIILGHYINAISNNTYFICMGLWGVMFILLNVLGEHNERW